MAYRPQFALPEAPEGYQDQPIVYVYDSTNTPAFATLGLSPGEASLYIPLPFDNDADFYLCGIKAGGTPYGLQFTDPYHNPLSDDFCPVAVIYDDVQPTPVEPPGLFCPAGSVMQVRFKNLG